MAAYLLLCTKLNYKWIKDLNRKTDMLNIGNRFELFGTGKDFLNKVLITQAVRLTNKEKGGHETEKICRAKDSVIWSKCQFIEGKNIFTVYIFNSGIMSKYMNDSKKQITQIVFQI